jgi:hypothetical protein
MSKTGRQNSFDLPTSLVVPLCHVMLTAITSVPDVAKRSVISATGDRPFRLPLLGCHDDARAFD